MSDKELTRLSVHVPGRMGRQVAYLATEVDARLAQQEKLRHCLTELAATVRGECPSLLNEDSGGDGQLALDIDDVLEAVRRVNEPTPRSFDNLFAGHDDIDYWFKVVDYGLLRIREKYERVGHRRDAALPDAEHMLAQLNVAIHGEHGHTWGQPAVDRLLALFLDWKAGR
jgi:hypothetical protein